MAQLRILRRRTAKQPVQQLEILTFHQTFQCCNRRLIQGGQIATEERFEKSVQFKQTTPALPAQPADADAEIRHGSHELWHPSDFAFQKLFLDIHNSSGRIQALGADPGAIEDGVATKQAIGIVQFIEALTRHLITAVRQPALGLQ